MATLAEALSLTQNIQSSTVSRLFAHSSNYDMKLTLDYNNELYPLAKGEDFSFVLASSLHRGNTSGTGEIDASEDDQDRYTWRPDGKGRRGLEEDYEYVMYGKVPRIVSIINVFKCNPRCLGL